jgi:alpha-tubulin suppressor-like RCC1 family protein
LGHGACYQFLHEPTKIPHSASFVAVSSGLAFSLALDDKGGAYAWGEVESPFM